MAGERIPQSSTARVVFQVVLTSDHYTAATGKTVAITISKNGAAYGNPNAGATNATEIGSGSYYVDLAAADTGTLGPLVIKGTAASSDNVYIFYDVVAVAVAGPTATSIAPTGTQFLVPVDIGNRALQRVGAELMDNTLGFADTTKNARQVSFAYAKLRQAELAENVWTFATRKTVLRPIDTNTMLLAPALWSSTSTYFVGSLVTDQNGIIWESIIINNVNNQPQNTPSAWVPYFGPLSVMLYDSSQSYLIEELVYTAAGDGTYNVYRSRINGNVVHPAMPNLWNTNATYVQNQVVTVYPTFLIGGTYNAGETQVDALDKNVYCSLVGSNTGNTPSTSPTKWAPMPTLTLLTQTVPSTTTVTAPTSSPISEWQQGTSYGLGAFVIFNAAIYVSILAANSGNFPNAAGSTWWTKATDGTAYMSLTDLNIGNAPATTPLQWTTTFTQGAGNPQWVQIGGAAAPSGVVLSQFNLTWPAMTGPVSQTSTRNAYRLPAGYLRRAPQDPKAGSISFLGAPTGRFQTDWEFNDSLLVTRDVNPIVFRFVADVTDVSRMSPLFCEGLAARIALEVCEPLTQSTAKLKAIEASYKWFIERAKVQNAIEQGAEEPAEDDFIACRL